MKTETETGEKFNAVRESRKWREAVGRRIAGMSDAEVVAYFEAAGERYAAEREEWSRAGVREHALAAR